MTITLTRRTAVLLFTAVAALAFVTTVAGCVKQKQQEPYRDAPTSVRDRSAVELYDNADGFTNWSEKCDRHGFRVFVAFHQNGSYAAMTAQPDPTCPKQ